MCGIVGIVGRQPVAALIVDALKRLEYRGYDSAGVAVEVGGRVDRRRAQGKIRALEAVLIESPLTATVGIGHTRWATHGVPSERNAHPQRGGRVSLVFQSFHLLPNMTALENVSAPMEIAGTAGAAAEATAWLGRVGLSARLDHYPHQLSGGEQQRVALARALAARPALLFADEPTGNLDGPNARAVADLMFDLVGEIGAALVLVTHDPALAKRADRQVVMADGLIV